MKEDKYTFLELMGNVDEQMIYQSCQPWKKMEQKKIITFSSRKIVACAIVIIVLGMAGIFHQQVEAAIRNFTTKISSILGISEDLTPYTEIINTSQTKEGVTVTLEEVILAENQLYAVFHLDWDKNLKLEEDMPVPTLGLEHEPKINGKEIMSVSSEISSCYGGEDLEDSQNILFSEVYEDGSLPEKIHKIELEVRVFLPTDNMEEGIPFTFHFSASKEQLEKDTYRIPIDYKVEASGGVELQFQELQLNRIFSRINVIANENICDQNVEYLLLGRDSEGNPLRYEVFGGIDHHLIFKNVKELPSLDSEWIELQLYEVEVPFLKEQEWEENILNQGEIQAKEDEMYDTDNKVYDLTELDYKPIGEKLRIKIMQDVNIQENDRQKTSKTDINSGMDTIEKVLSESDVKSIIDKKGTSEITWEDFVAFQYSDIGSGQYVYEYPLVEGSCLYLTGSDLKVPPESIYIINKNGKREDIKPYTSDLSSIQPLSEDKSSKEIVSRSTDLLLS